ncbi:MAG: type II toxin-antitoxin system VapC family toxin [Planctomycetes bacterium]|nr:type II toxin-antitoxin system VapC family toxin [Planctomycetota bacterium]
MNIQSFHEPLDTDMLTLFAHGHQAVSGRVGELPAEAVAITVLTVEEQLSGWYAEVRKAKEAQRLARAYRELARSVRFLGQMQILDYAEEAMRRYEEFRKRKVRIGRTDLRIAATVLEHGATLVTRNSQDFKHVPGLQLEDWSK